MFVESMIYISTRERMAGRSGGMINRIIDSQAVISPVPTSMSLEERTCLWSCFQRHRSWDRADDYLPDLKSKSLDPDLITTLFRP